MSKIFVLLLVVVSFAVSAEETVREFWYRTLVKIVRPVLQHAAAGTLKSTMSGQKGASPLEAFARTLYGVSPWLGSESSGSIVEAELRKELRPLLLKGIDVVFTPKYIDFEFNRQALVEAAYISGAFVKNPWLWKSCTKESQENIKVALNQTRRMEPGNNNWRLFTVMVEMFFLSIGEPWNHHGVHQHIVNVAGWYKGDGFYGDGPWFALDYYNSYVIQPFLNQVTSMLHAYPKHALSLSLGTQQARSARYAVLLERLIHTDGSYPITGRTITMRAGSFHHLADLAVTKKLPPSLPPAQIRSALTAVIRKTLTESASTFTPDGWLQIGVYGAQPSLAESYISIGSLYFTTFVFVPLGLPVNDEFWTAPAMNWTSRKIWSGENMKADHAS